MEVLYMKNPIISIQKGLDEYKAALEAEGYAVHYSGYDDSKANVTIISGIDEAYEEIEPSECHPDGDSCLLVLDVSNMSIEEVLKTVKTKECNC
jgi:hypothetical protein